MRNLSPYRTPRTLTPDIFQEMNRFFDNFGRDQLSTIQDDLRFHPACEIEENDDYYFMSLDIPGMKKEEIKIAMNDNVLNISGERRREERSTENKSQMRHYEKSYGYFNRSFTLPTPIDGNKIEAQYSDGVLELYLPKSAKSRAQNIEISSGKSSFFNKILSAKKQQKEEGENAH